MFPIRKTPGTRATQLAEAQLAVDALRFVLASKGTALSRQCSYNLLAPQIHEVTVPQGIWKVNTQQSKQRASEHLDYFPNTGFFHSLSTY